MRDCGPEQLESLEKEGAPEKSKDFLAWSIESLGKPAQARENPRRAKIDFPLLFDFVAENLTFRGNAGDLWGSLFVLIFRGWRLLRFVYYITENI